MPKSSRIIVAITVPVSLVAVWTIYFLGGKAPYLTVALVVFIGFAFACYSTSRRLASPCLGSAWARMGSPIYWSAHCLRRCCGSASTNCTTLLSNGQQTKMLRFTNLRFTLSLFS